MGFKYVHPRSFIKARITLEVTTRQIGAVSELHILEHSTFRGRLSVRESSSYQLGDKTNRHGA